MIGPVCWTSNKKPSSPLVDWLEHQPPSIASDKVLDTLSPLSDSWCRGSWINRDVSARVGDWPAVRRSYLGVFFVFPQRRVTFLWHLIFHLNCWHWIFENALLAWLFQQWLRASRRMARGVSLSCLEITGKVEWWGSMQGVWCRTYKVWGRVLCLTARLSYLLSCWHWGCRESTGSPRSAEPAGFQTLIMVDLRLSS